MKSRAASPPKGDPLSRNFLPRKDITRRRLDPNRPWQGLGWDWGGTGVVRAAVAGLPGTWPSIVGTGSAWQPAAVGPRPAQQFIINNLA